jgi:hypothetical protein
VNARLYTVMVMHISVLGQRMSCPTNLSVLKVEIFCNLGRKNVVDLVVQRCCAQVDDKKNLEYQAGQEEEAGGEQGKEPQEKDADGQKDKKAPDEAPAQDQEGGDEEQAEEDGEGPINEDTEEGYEQRQFAAPQVSSCPEHGGVSFSVWMCPSTPIAIQLACMI